MKERIKNMATSTKIAIAFQVICIISSFILGIRIGSLNVIAIGILMLICIVYEMLVDDLEKQIELYEEIIKEQSELIRLSNKELTKKIKEEIKEKKSE